MKASVAIIGSNVKARKPMSHGRDEEEPLARLAARQGRHPDPAAPGDRGPERGRRPGLLVHWTT